MIYDLVIREATIVDGLGREPRRADIAVEASRIAAIGEVGSDAVEVIDARRINDLPGGGPRTVRDPIRVHGVLVNGVRVFDGTQYSTLAKGPGQVLDQFLPTGPAAVRSAAE